MANSTFMSNSNLWSHGGIGFSFVAVSLPTSPKEWPSDVGEDDDDSVDDDDDDDNGDDGDGYDECDEEVPDADTFPP